MMKSSSFFGGAKSTIKNLTVFFILSVCLAISPVSGAEEKNQIVEYGKALELIEEGRRPEGKLILESLAGARFFLNDYAAFDLATLAFNEGDYSTALLYLTKFSKKIRGNPVERKANRLRILSACFDWTSDACGKTLRNLRRAKLPRGFTAEKLYIEAKRRESSGAKQKAYKLYMKIYFHYPVSPFAGKAVNDIARLRKKAGSGLRKSFPYATYDERKKRADRLMSAFRYEDAIKELETILGIGYSKKRKLKIYYTLARALFKARQREASKRTFLKLIDLYPASSLAGQSQSMIAIIDWNLGRADESETRLVKLSASGAGAGAVTRQRAFFIAGKIAESRGAYDQAGSYYKKALQLGRRTKLAHKLRWRLGWVTYLSGRYQKATQLLQTAYKKNRPRGDGKRLYWKIKSMERSGAITQSVKTRKALVSQFGHTYYGVTLTTSPLSPGYPDESVPVIESIDDFEENFKTAPAIKLSKKARLRLKRYDALRRIGQSERAVAELDLMRSYVPKKIKALAWLGYLYIKTRAPGKSLKLQNMALGAKSRKDDYENVFWRLYYPIANWEEITRQSRDKDIDPFLVLAVIRQESAFDPKALSPANARGLMQLIPRTAKRIYEKLEMDKNSGAPFHPDALFDPKVNIALGVSHLAELISFYNGSPAPALAAYNAGRKAVDRWLKINSDKPEDEFIENIPYSETGEYVKRVIRNWILYKRIYNPEYAVTGMDR
ncbi:Soluble lytic murein transglycosylase precursor [hydrothermal vent metagenome]|uniref:Soluble lytic murein transglycosylase n=1 Tax=hydrothermal vent metagenome TaxID=652676 RepID=A0A3B1BHS2_9ZZZZ